MSDPAMDAGTSGPIIPGTPTGPETLVQALDELRQLGFTEDVQVTDDGELCCRRCGHCDTAEDVELLELRRLEGASDPADMAAVLGVQCRGCGVKGSAVVRYGPEAGPGDSHVLLHIDDHRAD